MPTGIPCKMKKCKICGDEFLPKTPAQILCGKDHYQPCPVCGKLVLWNHTYEVPVCSKECKNARRKQRCKKKYGFEHPMQSPEVQRHHKDSMLANHGVESPLQSEEIRERAKATNRKRFGADWILCGKDKHEEFMQTMEGRYGGRTTLQSPVLRKKYEETMVKEHGAKNPMQCKDIQAKARATWMKNLGVDNPMKNPVVRAKAINTRIQTYGAMWPECIQAKARATWMRNYGVDNPFKAKEIIELIKERRTKEYGESWYTPGYHNKVSKVNLQFSEMLSNMSIEHSLERVIERKFFDFTLHNQDTVVEINPSYTHSEVPTHWNSSVSPEYHLSKTQLAAKYGLRCIHIWDWDDKEKIAQSVQPITKRIYARQCKLFVLYQDCGSEFLSKYDIYDQDVEKKIYLGLIYKDELVQVMTFRYWAFDEAYDYELVNLCTLPGYQVVGGASKLFHFAVNEYEMDNIIAFCDLSKFTGDVFEKMGMIKLGISPPRKIWSIHDVYILDSAVDSYFVESTLCQKYSDDTDISALMIDSGWLPVYDCGQAVFEYRKDDDAK